MSNLIQSIQEEFAEFWDLPISIGDVKYSKSAYDRINISLILENLIGNKDNFLLIVNPCDPTVSQVSFIEGLLSLLKLDLLAADSEVLSGINIGDAVVLINGRTTSPGIYLGTEKGTDGLVRHIVREDVKASAPVTYGIPLNLQWTIQPYNQAITTKNKRQAEVYGERLEEILNLPPGGLLAFQKSKMIFVAKNKSQLKEDLSNICLGGDPLTAVFSIADYISGRDFAPLGSDPLRREPTGGLVASLDHAVDIALTNDTIKLIMIDGASKLRSQFGSLEKLRNDSESCKVVCLLSTEDEDQINTLRKLGAKAWIWKRKDFNNIKLNSPAISGDDPVSIHINVLSHIGGPDPETIIVNQNPALSDAIDAAFRLINQINNKSTDDPDCAVFLRWSISLINNMLQLPIPVTIYHDYLDTLNDSNYLRLDEKLNSILNKVRASYGFSIPLDVRVEWEQLLENMQLIYMSLEEDNPKWTSISNLAENSLNDKFSLLIFDENYREAVKTFFAHRFGKILSASDIGNMPEETVLITGWKNKKNAARLFLAPYKKCTYLLYPHEKQRYTRVIQTHPASPESDIDIDLRTSQGIPPQKFMDSGDTDIGSLLDDIEMKLSTSIYRAHLQEYGEENMTDVRRILFEENLYCYISDNQGLNRLNRENKSIEKCQLSEISPEDELVFAESQRDMFVELLSILRQSEQYKLLFSGAQQWHVALLRYLSDKLIDEKELSNRLSAAGCAVGIITLKSWVNGDLISPSEINLRVLAKVIDDPMLNKNLDHVIDSTRKIHSLHIQTGRLLVRKIINAVVQDEDNEIGEETRKKIEDYSSKARILTVKEVLPEVVRVPAKAIGKLFEF